MIKFLQISFYSLFILFFIAFIDSKIDSKILAKESDKWKPLPNTTDADFLTNDKKSDELNHEHKSNSNQKEEIPKPDNKKWDTHGEYRPDSIIDLLEKYSDTYSKNVMKIAERSFHLSLKVRKADRIKIAKQAKIWNEKVYTNEKYLWQKEDRKRKQRSYLRSLNRKSLQKLVVSQVKIIKYLDKIVNRKVIVSDPYKNFKSDVYREYVKAQMSRNQYGQAIPFLEKYLKISPENAKEQTVYQYLSFCYDKQEQAARKAKSSNAIIRYLNKNKNKYMLTYAILKYGEHSRQYKELFQKIERENIELLN